MTIIYILRYTEFENPEPIFFYFPTKKAALEFIASERARSGMANAITDIEIDGFEIDTSKAGLADLLNSEVGTGF
tara:strand:+ start:382 stop:606 length:225 start_codon:yes stop_codon:yes gene_type:complete